MRAVLVFLLLAACGNDAVDYAKFLDPKVDCTDLHNKDKNFGDVAICFRNVAPNAPSEWWLCTSRPLECQVLGDKIKHVLVVPTVPTKVPAEVPPTESK